MMARRDERSTILYILQMSGLIIECCEAMVTNMENLSKEGKEFEAKE